MSWTLRVSGFVALTVQALWGLLQTFALSPAGPTMPPMAVTAHAQFGMLSILAVVTGFGIKHTTLSGRTRSVAVWSFIIGQWLLPASMLMRSVEPMLLATAYLWGTSLVVSLALVAWGTINARPD
ncbi:MULTISPECIES: hypothetical protein [Halobacterium]|uniref:hypothetical protein n=1 Tax=Halobacterium TaxID=2239 RepID=UPI001E3806AE|nr:MULTISPECIES: hypothetical protein [Halobacterium]MCD2203931.1 hypothetical protein [Halobacterium sp. KA-6]UHH26932.1 hypothetical protein LT974_16755 [Halobacterium noricense]